MRIKPEEQSFTFLSKSDEKKAEKDNSVSEMISIIFVFVSVFVFAIKLLFL
jgi:hypothetical protein